MTPAELEKEAERINARLSGFASKLTRENFLIDALRAVHDEGIEKAAVLADDEYGCDALAVDIQALKIGGGK